MNRDEMNYEQARRWILENYFDGDEDVRAVVAGDEEIMVMVRAVEALSLVVDGLRRKINQLQQFIDILNDVSEDGTLCSESVEVVNREAANKVAELVKFL